MDTFLRDLRTRATSGFVRTIALPEIEEERVREAADVLTKEGIAKPLLIGREHMEDEKIDALQKLLLEVRAPKKGTKDELMKEKAHDLAYDPLFYAMYLLHIGEVDGVVAGAARTSADVLRAGLWVVGKAEGIQTVSSSFYMVVPAFRGTGDGEVLTFADCAVVPQPTSAQLADIAIAAADARMSVVGDDPRIALLSYSTHGSGSGASVEIVRAALADVRKRRPDLIIDGEMQADAALIKAIAEKKMPGSSIGGAANVLIFPSLDAANIAYKLVATLCPGTSAIGPILQGMAKPVSDLSRGASASAIVQAATIVASQCKKSV